MPRFRAVGAAGLKYPVYALRKYEDIYEDENFVYIRTYHNIYILDIKNVDGNFTDRRLKLVGMKDLPAKVYPLKERYSSISQVVNSKRRFFIDNDGKISIYKPQKFFPVKYTKVLSVSKTWDGNNRLMTKLPVVFVTEQVSEYIGYIQIGNAYYLYELSSSMKKTTRRKI